MYYLPKSRDSRANRGDIIRSPGKAFVEGDASSASYFLAGAAVTGGTVTVEGCGTSSLQVNFSLPYFVFLNPNQMSLYLQDFGRIILYGL